MEYLDVYILQSILSIVYKSFIEIMILYLIFPTMMNESHSR